ncbi:MAG: DciA family protein [Acidiferrobacteraceae bacterium]
MAGLRTGHFARGEERALVALADAWKRCVSAPLCEHARPAHFRGGWALIHVDSPVWLSQLRHQTPTVVQRLKREPGLGTLEGLHARVRPAPLAGPARPAPRRFTFSLRALATLEAAARDTGDPELREALAKLVRRNTR